MARTDGHGNPNWTRDEVILALDLYFECKGSIPSRDDSRVQALSSLLRRLPFHAGDSRRTSFRNPSGVAFKLQNLRQVATGKGLGNVSETDRKVWTEFGAEQSRIKELADLIRAGVDQLEAMGLADEGSDADEEEFVEGRVLTELHKRKERNRKIRQRLLALKRRDGLLVCEICSCRARVPEPALEDSIFEAHHRVPMSISNERKTRLADMALLCANCHRLVHRAISQGKRWLDVDEARTLLGLTRQIA